MFVKVTLIYLSTLWRSKQVYYSFLFLEDVEVHHDTPSLWYSCTRYDCRSSFLAMGTGDMVLGHHCGEKIEVFYYLRILICQYCTIFTVLSVNLSFIFFSQDLLTAKKY